MTNEVVATQTIGHPDDWSVKRAECAPQTLPAPQNEGQRCAIA